MSWLKLSAGAVVGILMGFAGVNVWVTAPGLPGTAIVPHLIESEVDLELRFDDPTFLSPALKDGWGAQLSSGSLMDQPLATVSVQANAPAHSDLQLILEGRGPPPGIKPRALSILVNGTEIGEIDIKPGPEDLRRRLIVPREVFNARRPVEIAFRAGAGPQPAFGLRLIAIRDASLMRNPQGFVDGCAPDRIFGWAVADDLPSGVVVSVKGQRVNGRTLVVQRPDLSRQNLPGNAGFEIRFARPLAKGSEVEVKFPGGRPLRHSPCKI